MNYHPWKFFLVRNQTAQNFVSWKSRIHIASCFEVVRTVIRPYQKIQNYKFIPLCAVEILLNKSIIRCRPEKHKLRIRNVRELLRIQRLPQLPFAVARSFAVFRLLFLILRSALFSKRTSTALSLSDECTIFNGFSFP